MNNRRHNTGPRGAQPAPGRPSSNRHSVLAPLLGALLLLHSLPVPGLQSKGHSSARVPDQFGYRGPESLGPFRIDTRYGSVPVAQIWAAIGKPKLPESDYLCYFDAGTATYLALGRGSDDRNRIRTAILSSGPNCFDQSTPAASGFSTWKTGEGIGLGSSEDAVRAAYGPPTTTLAGKTNWYSMFPGYWKSPRPKLAEPCQGGIVWNYLPRRDAPDLSAASFGMCGHRVVWIELSSDE